jgi:drug/metabolite transporter (DMT)-like permease
MSPLAKGIIFALAACFVWGLIFIIPYYIQGFDTFEIALGRHFFYGSLSTVLLVVFWKRLKSIFSWRLGVRALIYALIANIIYYSCVVCAARYSSPSIAALVLGVSPLILACVGNWRERHCSFSQLIIPTILLLTGLVLINLPLFEATEWQSDYLLGVLAACVALVAWCWYVIANALFLKNSSVTAGEWSTLMGAATFVWVLVLGCSYECWLGVEHCHRFITPSSELALFVSGCLVLGVICSWLGAYFWNTASNYLPIALAGQLTIFETIFGVLFVYAVQQAWPLYTEMIGIVLMLAAVTYGMTVFSIGKRAAATH